MALINRLFNLRPGDFSRGLPLFGYYFLIISSYVMLQTVRVPLFLEEFDKLDLAYADGFSAALVGVVAALYIRLAKHAALRNLLVGSLLFYGLNIVALWWGVVHYQQSWVIADLYVWVGIFGVLATAQVWTLANFVWTTREAKRLFGLLASGGTAGTIFSGFFSSWMVRRFGTESILLVVAAFTVFAAPLVVIIWRQRESREVEGAEDAPYGFLHSFRLVRESSHLQAIAVLICLSSIVTTAAGWQLNAIAKETLVEKDNLTAFFGLYAGYTGLGSLLAQLLVTGKLLRRFGVGVALLVLPVCLTMGSAAVLVFGTLWAATLLKGSDKVVRYSIDVPALQLLYLPVPANIKLQVKSFLDTVIWRFGDLLASLTVVLFVGRLQFTARQVSWVTITLLGVWVISAFIARQQYVATLRQNIQSVRIHPEEVNVPMLDQFTTMVFAEKLRSSDPNEIMYALDLFEMGQRSRVHQAVKNLLDHPSPHIRRKAISVLNTAEDKSARQQIAALLQDENLDVRTEALTYLTRHDEMDPLSYIDTLRDFADSSIRTATVSFLTRPGESQNLDAARMILDGMIQEQGGKGPKVRLEAANLIASLPDYFEPQLALLIEDSDDGVRRQAIRAAGALRKRRFVPGLIRYLANPALSSDAADALALFGDATLGTLRDHLADANEPIGVRREIPDVLRRIGSANAAAALADNLLQGDIELRFRMISALNKLCELRRNLTLDKQLIETVMLAEIMGHYRSYQILGSKNGEDDQALKQAMDGEIERIFRLMKLLFPTLDLQNAYRGIQSSDPVLHANALEFLDNTLNPQLRTHLVPLIDTEVSLQERVRLANRFLGFSVQA